MIKKQTILGIGITADTKGNILKYIVETLHKGGKKLFITTPNPEILVYAQNHLDYRNRLNSSDIALPDGIGLLIAGQLMGKRIEERITGVDFIEELCKVSREKPLSMGFLGGRGKVAEEAAECLKKKYQWIEVVYASDELPMRRDKNREIRIENKEKDEKISIHNSPFAILPQMDILFVAYGAPKQEEWISEHLATLPVKAAMGVGGAFDFISGNVRRAPKFMRAIGLEWLFRLLIQPWRMKRQLALLTFMLLVIKEAITLKLLRKP